MQTNVALCSGISGTAAPDDARRNEEAGGHGPEGFPGRRDQAIVRLLPPSRYRRSPMRSSARRPACSVGARANREGSALKSLSRTTGPITIRPPRRHSAIERPAPTDGTAEAVRRLIRVLRLAGSSRRGDDSEPVSCARAALEEGVLPLSDFLRSQILLACRDRPAKALRVAEEFHSDRPRTGPRMVPMGPAGTFRPLRQRA